MTVHHVIFDCDGVLVDSEPLSMRADVMLLQRFGISISEAEAHHRFVGTTFQAMLDLMAAEYGTQFPPGLHAVKNAMVDDLYRAELKIVPGIEDVLHKVGSLGLKASIGSNSPKARVELAVSLTGIASHFQRIVSFEDVDHGKPAPDIFLKAARLAGFAPADCLVVEDSVTGVTAALAAGMQVVGFTGTHANPVEHEGHLRRLGASTIIHDMPALTTLLPSFAQG
jgi:HAD superfamily hydrolase (TIGR01509 family)